MGPCATTQPQDQGPVTQKGSTVLYNAHATFFDELLDELFNLGAVILDSSRPKFQQISLSIFSENFASASLLASWQMLCTSYIIGCRILTLSSTCLCIFEAAPLPQQLPNIHLPTSLCFSAASSRFLDASREKKLEICWGVRKSAEKNNRSPLVFLADLEALALGSAFLPVTSPTLKAFVRYSRWASENHKRFVPWERILTCARSQSPGLSAWVSI